MGTFSVNNDAAAAAVSNEQPPPWLVWLRYNLFFVLYPLGILSEMRLVYLAAEPATEKFGDERVGWLLWAILAVYIPGMWHYDLFSSKLHPRKLFLLLSPGAFFFGFGEGGKICACDSRTRRECCYGCFS